MKTRNPESKKPKKQGTKTNSKNLQKSGAAVIHKGTRQSGVPAPENKAKTSEPSSLTLEGHWGTPLRAEGTVADIGPTLFDLPVLHC